MLESDEYYKNAGTQDCMGEIHEQIPKIYLGYPVWKKDNYAEVTTILERLFSEFGQDFKHFKKAAEIADQI